MQISIGVGAATLASALVAAGFGSAQAPAPVARTMRAAGCTFQQSRAEKGTHISRPNERVRYWTFPPSSGRHHPLPVPWGAYEGAVDPRRAVHNLEHGGIVIWYGKLTAAAKRALFAFYAPSPNGILVTAIRTTAPFVSYPQHKPLGSRIALTAWTAPVGAPDRGTANVSVCPRVVSAAFRAFRDAFRGKGPERLPVSELRPGT